MSLFSYRHGIYTCGCILLLLLLLLNGGLYDCQIIIKILYSQEKIEDLFISPIILYNFCISNK
jgi:predicted metal-binding membrane protein